MPGIHELDPCPGCDTKQYGTPINSHLTKRRGAPIKICRACGQYEDVTLYRKKQVLKGVGKNETPPSRC
jgi:hypothetical protein